MNCYVETLGRGPDLVLLHGWGLHGGVFARVAQSLADDWCVHCVDLPGHGRSPASGGFDAAAVADALAAQFPLPLHVLGWSLGGLVAQHWAARHPGQVRSLVLVATSPRFVRDESWPHAQERAAIAAVGQSLGTDFDATLRRFLMLQTLGAPQARDTLAALDAILFAHGRPQGLAAALDCLVQTDVRALAAVIGCPVGLFFGARDAITPLGAGQWLAQALSDARLEVFDRASHAPFLSHEDDFVARLTRFLDAHR